MKASTTLVLALGLSAAACMGPHITTGAAPAPTAETLTCMTKAVTDLGYTITGSQPSSGFLTAEKRDLSSPDSAEYSQLSVSVYTNRDGGTEYTVMGGRSRETADGKRTTWNVMVLDADGQAADDVAKRCGRH